MLCNTFFLFLSNKKVNNKKGKQKEKDIENMYFLH